MPDAYLQYGCFGLIALIVVWFGGKVIPNALSAHQETVRGLAADHKETIAAMVGEFRAENQRRDERHDRELTRRDAGFERLALVVEGMAAEIREMREHLKS